MSWIDKPKVFLHLFHSGSHFTMYMSIKICCTFCTLSGTMENRIETRVVGAIDGHLGVIHILALGNKALRMLECRSPCAVQVSFPLGTYQEGLLNHAMIQTLSFRGNFIIFSSSGLYLLILSPSRRVKCLHSVGFQNSREA